MQTGTAHRRSLLSFSSLSAQELIAHHKACDAATKQGPYTYTRTRCELGPLPAHRSPSAHIAAGPIPWPEPDSASGVAGAPTGVSRWSII